MPSAGVPLWTNSYDGPNGCEDHPQAVVVDRYDNVYVTGYSEYDFLAIKYSPSVALKLERIANAAVLTWGNSNFTDNWRDKSAPGAAARWCR